MANNTLTIESLAKLETWEVALRVITESDDLYDKQLEIQSAFEIDLSDTQSVVDLPADSLRDLKEKIIFTVNEAYENNRKALYDKVCIEFEYCKKRGTLSAKALEAAIILLDVAQTGGIAYLIFFGFRRGLFDELCGCDK